MKTSHLTRLALLAAGLLPLCGHAQVNSGSNGSDGALNPTGNLVIDMADHPDGIYHYTSVNIPAGVTVSFVPNAGNKPVVWLVQGNCVISGTIELSGKNGDNGNGGIGGPGGWRGGSAANQNSQAGQGLGGGAANSEPFNNTYAGGGSFGTLGMGKAPGPIYGNQFLLPMLGGSGGGGRYFFWSGIDQLSGGGGGGGAFLIVFSGNTTLTGSINALGGAPSNGTNWAGCGSGGAVRIIATEFNGQGAVDTRGSFLEGDRRGGLGRIRIDSLQRTFSCSLRGVMTEGFQPIIFPPPGQGIQLAIQSLAGVAVNANPSGVLANPDVIIPAQQANPIPIVVRCTNVPLNTEISVVVHPANGPDVLAVGLNNGGTLASSTATVSLNMPRGGGIIYAKAVTGIAGGGAAIGNPADAKTRSLAETGWTADGERFVTMKITAALGGAQRITYITESGKRLPVN